MTFVFSFYTFILIFTSGIVLMVGYFFWTRRKNFYAQALLPMMAAIFIWTMAYAFEFAVIESWAKEMFHKLVFTGIAIAPIIYFLFIMEFTQTVKIWSRKQIVLIMAIPALAILFTWTNEFHHTIIISYQTGSNNATIYNYGWFYYFVYSYIYMCLIVAFVRLAMYVRKSEGEKQKQTFFILLASLFPMVTSILFVSPINPFPEFDWTPAAFSISGVLFSWSIFEYRMFDLLPKAQKSFIENLRDGVLVLDMDNAIVETNPAAERIFSAVDAIRGRKVFEVIRGNEVMKDFIERNVEIQLDMTVDGERPRMYNANIAMMVDTLGMHQGKLITIHDITQFQKTVMELQRQCRLFLSIFKAMPIPVIISSKMLEIVDINTFGIEFFGYDTKNELMGKPLRELIVDPDVSELQMNVVAVLDMNEMMISQYKIERKNKSRAKTEVTISAVYNADKMPIYFIYIFELKKDDDDDPFLESLKTL